MCYMSHVTNVTCNRYQVAKSLPKTPCVIYFWKALAKFSSMVMQKMSHVTQMLHVACHTCYMSPASNYLAYIILILYCLKNLQKKSFNLYKPYLVKTSLKAGRGLCQFDVLVHFSVLCDVSSCHTASNRPGGVIRVRAGSSVYSSVGRKENPRKWREAP